MGPYAGVDYNLTLCPLQSRVDSGIGWLPMVNVLESTLSPGQGLCIWPLNSREASVSILAYVDICC
jgi:hypothetical protein